MSSILDITYEDMQSITPSDTDKVPGGVAAGFGSDSGGPMTVVTLAGSTVTRTTVAGLIYNVSITQILQTGTSATGTFAVFAHPFGQRGGDRA
jgi:hypothetical protein